MAVASAVFVGSMRGLGQPVLLVTNKRREALR